MRLAGVVLAGITATALIGCADSAGPVVSLSLSSPDALDPDVGQEVRIVVRAVHRDGSSTDVTADASCQLSGATPPGRLEGTTFVATDPGTTEVACDYLGARGTLGLTVRGFRQTTIAALQSGELAEGTRVEIEAVVYGLDPAGDFTDFWAQDQGGGPRSGMHMRDLRELEDGEAGISPVDEGDLILVRGSYVERDGRSTVEYEAVELLGSASPVVEELALDDVDPAIWEGCLVAVEDLVVADPAVDDYTWSVTAEGSTATLLVETFLYDPERASGDVVERLAGPLWQWQDGDSLLHAIAPRDADDVLRVAGGTTVADLHRGEVAVDTEVTLLGLVVTHVDTIADPDDESVTLYDLYVQDPAGGPHSGLVLRDYRAAPSEVSEGQLIDIVGLFAVVRGRAVVEYSALTTVGTQTPTVEALDVDGLELRDYESALIRVTNVRATAPDFSSYTWQVTDNRSGGTATLEVDTLFVDQRPAVDDVFDAITGVVFCDAIGCTLAPRRSDDLDGPGF